MAVGEIERRAAWGADVDHKSLRGSEGAAATKGTASERCYGCTTVCHVYAESRVLSEQGGGRRRGQMQTMLTS